MTTRTDSRHITLIGAGLAGAVLATLLVRRGWRVDVYEKRGDPRVQGYGGGRSIILDTETLFPLFGLPARLDA